MKSKSLDVSKAIDKAAGMERTERVAPKAGHENFVGRDNMKALREGTLAQEGGFSRPWMSDPEAVEDSHWTFAPSTPEAEQWQGWGTALKPAHEPIIVARKPLIGTVAQNVLEHGTGAINIDACRIGTSKDVPVSPRRAEQGPAFGDLSKSTGDEPGFDPNVGRWPANVVLLHLDGCVRVGDREVKGDGNWKGSTKSVGYEGGWDTSDHPRDQRVPDVETQEVWECAAGCPVAELDAQSGISHDGTAGPQGRGFGSALVYGDTKDWRQGEPASFGGAGGASRFFYTAKVSRAERNTGLESVIRCRCETNSEWVNEGREVQLPADTGPSPARDIGASGTEDDSEWNTSSSGSPRTAPSRKDSRSTTEMRTNSTTESRTSNSSMTSPTSDITPRTTDSSVGNGSADATSVESGSEQLPTTSISPQRDGSGMDVADHATSEKLSSQNSAVVRCGDCGGVVQGALRNSHPT